MEKKIIHLGKICLLSAGVMASAAMLTGCSQEVAVPTAGSGDGTRVEVTASFQPLENAALTRAADGLDDAASGFSLTTSENGASKVRVMVDENDGSYAAFDYGITGATAIEAPATAPTFPRGENSVNVYGWYPAKDLNGFTVAADQSGEADYCLSDLLWAISDTSTREGTTVNKPAELSFAHVMSKVKVNLMLAEGVTVKAVKLKNVKPTVTVSATTSGNTVTGYTTSSLAGSAGDITLLSGGSLTSESDAADKVLCGVFPPQTISGALLAVTATYNGGSDQTITYSLAAEKAFDTNKEYTISILLNPTNVETGTVMLSDWDAETGSVTVKTDAPAPTLSADNLTLTYGGANGTITPTLAGASAFGGISSNPAVATVTGGSTLTVVPTGAGTCTIQVYPTNGTSDFTSATCTVTVNKGTPSVTAPTYVTSTLTYNGSAQTLINAGSSPAGTTMKYATGTSAAATGAWSTSLPTGTNAGDYYVWYKVEGGTNYNDVAPTKISGSKTIAKKAPTITLSKSEMNISGAGTTETFTITYDGDGTLSVASNNTSVATVSRSGNTVTVTSVDGGSADITVTATAGTNYAAYTATDKKVTVNVNVTMTLSDLKTWVNEGHAGEKTYLGYFVKADGSISTDNTDAIGVVAYYGNAAVDASATNSRILVLATDDASGASQWKTSETGGQSAYNSETALNGIAFTNAYGGNSEYPAAKAAKGYSKARPTGASIWFLPSKGQWTKMIEDGYTGITSGYFWSSTENAGSDGQACYYRFDESSWKNMTKRFSYRVRTAFAY